jgi:hypothetical protein
MAPKHGQVSRGASSSTRGRERRGAAHGQEAQPTAGAPEDVPMISGWASYFVLFCLILMIGLKGLILWIPFNGFGLLNPWVPRRDATLAVFETRGSLSLGIVEEDDGLEFVTPASARVS